MAGNSNITPAQETTILKNSTTVDDEAGVSDPLALENELNKGAAANVVTPENLSEILANLRSAGIHIQDTNFAYLSTDWTQYPASTAYLKKAKELDGFEAKVKAMVDKASKDAEYKGLKIEQVFDANIETNRIVLKNGKRIQL